MLAIFLKGLFYLYAVLPNDFSRTKVILTSLKDTTAKPRIIVFGDSRAVFGIDAKTISANMPGHPLVYNLSSVGQSLQEGAHYLTLLPASVKDVLHCIAFENFGVNHVRLPDDKAIAMTMYGYNLDTATANMVQEVNPILKQNKWYIAYQGRTIIKTAINTGIRQVLDNEKFGNNFHDLYFPHIYTTLRHPAYPFNKPAMNFDSLHTNPLLTDYVGRLRAYCQLRGIGYHIVLMPMNPDVPMPSAEKRQEYLATVKKALPGLDFIDMSQALSNTEFYDGLHPNRKGAIKLSAMLATYIH